MIKAIIVDNNKSSINILKELLIESDNVDVVGCFEKTQDAKEYIGKNNIDVAFLNIDMGEINGVELVNEITFDLNYKCEIVFVTAYDKYAVEAFEVNALDYLVKPVSRERLNKTIERIAQNIRILPSKIKVQCFGQFKIISGDTEVKFRTTKAQELIAFLIDKRGKSVIRSEIIDSLWGEFDGDKAIINYNTTLCYAKKALLQHNIDLPVQYDRGSYKIDLKNIDCDYLKFIECSFDGVDINKDNIAYYEEMAMLYTGEYLGANDYSWAEQRRMDVKDKYLRLLLRIAKFYSIKKENSRVIDLMKKGFEVAPLNNEITYTLVEALVEEGNYSLAVNYYKSYKDALGKLLHREPSDSIKKLLGIAIGA